MSSFLNFHNISKVYPGIHALKAVDFALERGEIHCLVGENGSGKSTFIKIVSGVVEPEPGAVMEIDGQVLEQGQPQTSIKQGIRVIYQDLALFPNLTVQENIAFSLYSNNTSSFVDWKAVRKTAEEAMEAVNLNIDPNRLVSSLSIAEQQLVEIARSITGNLNLLILDEPTASLTRVEVDRLFATIRKIQERGVVTLFVSHKLNEIFEIAERITVFRDGVKVGVFNPSELDQAKLIHYMTGEEVNLEHLPKLSANAPNLLQVDSLSRRGNYKDINFSLSEGEILGITGRLGSGRTELALSLFGMARPDSGEVRLGGKKLGLRSNASALKAGIAYVPEDRRRQGLVMPQSIEGNLTLTILHQLLGNFGLIDEKKSQEIAEQWVRYLGIKIPSLGQAVQTLSGGNQQKVVLAKWLATKPRLLILDEPTVGIDVFAKDSVHRLVKQLSKEGIGIILISDEVHEVVYNSHRIIVMDQGHIVDELFPQESDVEEILLERYNLA